MLHFGVERGQFYRDERVLGDYEPRFYVSSTSGNTGDTYYDQGTSTGPGTNYAVSVSIADTQTASYPTLFSSPSFSASASNMTGGTNAGANYGTIYSYQVPTAGYAANGNILSHTDSVMGTWNFSYDAVDRLTSATAVGGNPAQYAGKYGCWTYDSYGNRTLEAFSSVPCTGSNLVPQVQAFYGTVNTNNRIQSISGNILASFSYDASGNTLYDGNNEYWYDAEGQLCAVQSQRYTGAAVIQYIYDAEGARIGKGTLASAPSSYTATCAPPLGSGFTLTARYLVDLGGNQVTELSEQGLPTPQTEKWQHSNVWTGGKLTATYDYNNGQGGIHFELADPLGTKRVQANALGQIDEQCTSLPFGNDINNPPNLAGTSCTFVANSLSTADDATEHHFTQKERDTETGNDYFLARYYSSALGRFTTPDWSAKEEPVPYANLGDPQSLNLYAYVRNNPLTSMDLDGHCWGGGWCDIHGNPYQTTSEIEAAAKAAQLPTQQKKAQPKKALPKVVVAADPPTSDTKNGINTDREVIYRGHSVNKDGLLGTVVNGEINLRETILKATLGSNPHTCTPSCEASFPYFEDSQGVGNGQFLDVKREWTFNRRPVPVWDPIQKSPAKSETLHEDYGKDPNRGNYQMTYEHPW